MAALNISVYSYSILRVVGRSIAAAPILFFCVWGVPSQIDQVETPTIFFLFKYVMKDDKKVIHINFHI